MIAKMKTKSALSYFGSDSEVAAELAAMLDGCKHVTIPFCGGMSILPHLKARAIVANDLNAHAINFYRVVSGWHGETNQKELIRLCQQTLSHPDNLDLAKSYLLAHGDLHLQRAWGYWVLCWVARKGKGGTKSEGQGLPSVRRTAVGGTNATRVMAAANDLSAWAKHFERCEWVAVCFRQLIPQVADDMSCGMYVDAPWVGAGSNYLHPFVEQDHRDLAACLNRFQLTTIVVRYDDKPLVRELYKGWTIIEASSRDQCNAVKGELWITNKAG